MKPRFSGGLSRVGEKLEGAKSTSQCFVPFAADRCFLATGAANGGECAAASVATLLCSSLSPSGFGISQVLRDVTEPIATGLKSELGELRMVGALGSEPATSPA